MKVIRWLAIVLLAVVVGSFSLGSERAQAASTIEVSLAAKLTTDAHYDRNPSVFKASDGTYWLFFARSTNDSSQGYGCDAGGFNCDADSYDVYYVTSSDGGVTWSAETKISQPSTGQRGMAAFQDSGGQIWVFVGGFGGANNNIGYYTYSGGTWAGPTAVPGPVGANHLDALQASDGKIWVFYEATDASADAVYSSDAGVSWSAKIDVAGPYGGVPKAIQDSGGALNVIYTNADKIWRTTSPTGMAGTWSAPSVVVDGGPSPNFDYDPVIYQAGGSYGVFWAPWSDPGAGGTSSQSLKVVTSPDGATWSSAASVTNGGYGTTYWWDMWPEVLVDGGTLRLFYGSEKNGAARGDGNIFMYTVDWPLSNNHYEAIQPAIDAASSGDTINVAAGTYDEQVMIDKSLTLQGAGDTTVIKPSSDAKLTTVLDGHWWGATKQIAGIVVANVPDGSSVTVKSLKVDGASVTAKPAGADYVAGIFYRETGGTIDAVTVTNMTVGTTGTEVRGDGIYLSAVANTVSVEVKGSTLTNYDKNGIDAWGNKLSLNIHGNTLTGRGPLPQGDEVQNGVVIGDGAAGTVDQNVISNHTYSPETWWSAGIMFLDSGGSSSATGNTLTSNQIGVMFQDGNGSASGNTVSGGKLGLYAQGTKAGTWTASFTGNTVGGSDTVGIGGATYDLGASLTISIGNNSLTGGTGDGVAIGDAPEYDPAGTVAATITGNVISGWQNGVNLLSSLAGSSTIYSNSIAGNVSRGVLNQTAVLADASGNWWGTNTPAGVAGQVSADVDYTPWLDSGNDKEPGTPGFQGDFSTLNVDDDSPQSGATGRVQEGVNMVSGSTVKVWPGTYSEQVSIAKANLTLDGAGIGSTIVKPASVTANTTSLYSGAPIATIILVNGVTGVTIKDLTVDGSSAAFNSCSPGYMGIFYRNASGTIDSTRVTNIFHPSARGCQSVIGIFAQSGGGGGSTVQVSSSTVDNYGKNGITCNELGTACTISGNTVTGRGPVGAGDAAQNGIQLGFGATGTVDGNTVSNNSYTGPNWAATDVLVVSANVGITGNTLNNGQLGLYYIDGSGTISGNTVSASTAGVGRPDYWGIAVSDPPGLSPSPFEERAAPPAGGFSAAPMGAGVMTVVVSGNTLTGDGSASSVGLEADAGWGPQDVSFTASGNTISNWGTGVTVAQCTSSCSGAVFTSVDVGPNNNISGNDNGVFLGGVSGVVISGNEIHHNLNRSGYAGAGILLWGDNDNNQILGNVVHDNDRQGIFVGHDTLISTGNAVSGNTIYNNGLNTNPNPPDASAYGIQLWNADSNMVTNNEVYGHDDWFAYPGFDFAQGIYLFDSNDNLLSGNYLHDNNYGVGLWGPGRGDGSNLINFNNISGNTGYGVRNFDALTVFAENNWWGSCSGPYHPTANPLGTGDAVSDNVDFTPWITGACDTDADLLTDDAERLVWFTDPRNPDTDGDGCADGEEALYSEPALGGQRDPLNKWDFFDVTGDKSIDLSDALDILTFFGNPGLLGTPGDLRDRSIPDPLKPWRTADSDEGVDLTDALNNLLSFGHSCEAAP
jgi:parallel beta-helix repeat protein